MEVYAADRDPAHGGRGHGLHALRGRPHPGLAQRNAYAHVWLGLKVIFGEEWRERTAPASIRAFLDWMDANPNAEYDDYAGPREELTAEDRGELF